MKSSALSTVIFQAFSRKAAMTVALIGCVVIFGWLFNIAILKSVLPGLVTMKANTAVGFIIGGFTLRLWHQQSTSLSIKRITQISAFIVLLIGLLTLIEYGFDINLGIDQLLFQESANSVATTYPGRMAPNTALNFLLLGSALLLLCTKQPFYFIIHLLTILAFLIAFLGCLGYFYGNTYFYQYGSSFTAMALHTSVAFLLLCISILFARPERGLTAAVTMDNAGGIMAQRMLFPAIVIPPIVCWFILIGYRQQIYTPEMGICLLGIINVVFFCTLIWSNAGSLGVLDNWRQRAELSLQQANTALIEKNEILHKEIIERQEIEAALRQSKKELLDKNQQIEAAFQELSQAQTQLIQSEKMSSLGLLVAGIAHEINNPINFVHGNLPYLNDYIQDILKLVQNYQENYPDLSIKSQDKIAAIDIEFIIKDITKILQSMRVGTDRVRQIVLSLRTFSRLDEADMKSVDIHEGIDSTLMILEHLLKAKSNLPAIKIIKKYSKLPLVECYAGQLNQVFMNLLANAIDALEESRVIQPQIIICTEMTNQNQVSIRIADNGSGMSESVQQNLFNPFFTTKSPGKGTGLGLSISYQIITKKHHGKLECISALGQGTEFIISIPLHQHV